MKSLKKFLKENEGLIDFEKAEKNLGPVGDVIDYKGKDAITTHKPAKGVVDVLEGNEKKE